MTIASHVALTRARSTPGAARNPRVATRSARVVTRNAGRPARTLTPAALGLDGQESTSGEARYTTLEVGDFAKLDLGRTARTGLPEVVWGPGKTPGQIAKIMLALRDRQSAVMATRVDPEVYEKIRLIEPAIEYDSFARVCTLQGSSDAPPTPVVRGTLAVLTAGTADLAVAEEATITARLMGVEDVRLIADVGVAGLQRLLSRLDEIREADVVMVVAGMDGALPSVCAGLIDAPVIAVPTSVGYGAAMGGLSPLMATLNSCATGVTVVNIDNGFGATMSAIKMLRAAERLAQKMV